MHGVGENQARFGIIVEENAVSFVGDIIRNSDVHLRDASVALAVSVVLPVIHLERVAVEREGMPSLAGTVEMLPFLCT